MKTRALVAIFSIALAAHGQNPAPAGEEVYQVGAGVSQPKVIRQVQPEHPARGFRISGAVLIGLVVGSNGEPRDVHVVKSLEKEIDQSAVEAVQKWRFEPAKKDGKPVAAKVSVEIRFHDM
ncbi:MAG: periplasmic protein TonB [Bryobacterales bacterium]|nr:periplasmic protein TonB [Bryobacterales bacterium]